MKQYFWANQDAEFGMLAVLKKWTELEDSDDNWYNYKTICRGQILVTHVFLLRTHIQLHVQYWVYSKCFCQNYGTTNLIKEAHGPDCSSEKTVQINKHMWFYHNVDQEKKNSSSFELSPKEFGWNWSGDSEEDF